MIRLRVVLLLAAAALCSCGDRDAVVVYASVDRQLAEPPLEAFERATGMTVRAAYDVEANKTVGLVNRLTAERSAPRADLFWSGEFARTIELCERGVLAPSSRPMAGGDALLSDPAGCWHLMAGRLRVLLLHASESYVQPNASLADLAAPAWKGRACIANPRFGTTATHFTALLVRWGETAFRRWLRDLRSNSVAMLPGNAQVKESVSRGACSIGLTDTDDALAAIAEGAAVSIVVPDQHDAGVFVVPSSVAVVRDAPNPEGAASLMGFLLSAEAEEALAGGAGGFLPLRHPQLRGPPGLPALEHLKVMRVDYVQVARALPVMLRILEEEWPR